MKLSETQKRLAEDNHNLIYTYIYNKKLDIDEWYDILAIGFCKAVATYDPNKGYSLSTYAYRCMDNSYKHELRMRFAGFRVPESMIISTETPVASPIADLSEITTVLGMLSSEDDVEGEAVMNDLVERFYDICTETEKKIFSKMLIGDRLNDIVKSVGCSHTTVSNTKKKFSKYIQSM